MIFLINNLANWRFICQRKQEKIEKYVIHKNSTRIDHKYRVVDQVMARKKVTLNMKHHLTGRIIYLKHEQTEPLPLKRELS